ncbi:MAG: hypothetical protein PWQ97_1691, partial [Tepidanaerobacteraceae bacterium]|nr:hypothetical protein [Tepidanaerobacteraceae bacterium]
IGTRSGPKIVDELPLMEEVYKNMQIL